MTPSPFEQPNRQQINRVTITVTGVPGTGKSGLAGNILASLRAQGFQVGCQDPFNDQPTDRVRYNQNTIIAIDVKEPEVGVKQQADELDKKATALEARAKDLEDKLNTMNNLVADAKAKNEALAKENAELKAAKQ